MQILRQLFTVTDGPQESEAGPGPRSPTPPRDAPPLPPPLQGRAPPAAPRSGPTTRLGTTLTLTPPLPDGCEVPRRWRWGQAPLLLAGLGLGLGLPLPLLPRANTPRSGIMPLPPLVPTQSARVMPHLHATANANVLEGLLSYPHLDTLLTPYHTCSSTCLLLRCAHPSCLSLTCHVPVRLAPFPSQHPTTPQLTRSHRRTPLQLRSLQVQVQASSSS